MMDDGMMECYAVRFRTRAAIPRSAHGESVAARIGSGDIPTLRPIGRCRKSCRSVSFNE